MKTTISSMIKLAMIYTNVRAKMAIILGPKKRINIERLPRLFFAFFKHARNLSQNVMYIQFGSHFRFSIFFLKLEDSCGRSIFWRRFIDIMEELLFTGIQGILNREITVNYTWQ